MDQHWTDSDKAFLGAALDVAAQAVDAAEVPVGAVVVVGNEIVASAHNRSRADHDPSAHAEIVALRAAGNALNNHRLIEATVYVTLEPCVMCMGALAEARIRRLVFGAYDQSAGAAGSLLDLSTERCMTHRFEVNGGLLQEPCAQLLHDFFAARREQVD